MATRPKAVIESRDGEELSPITITKNILTDDGQNLHDILSDRQEDMMTPAIENSSSMFKVGQGDNVDYSENVVDGAYESCVLKGKSLVNSLIKTIDTTWNLNLENWSVVSTAPSDYVLKPSTTYSVIVYVTEKTCPDREDLFWVGDVDGKKDKVTHDIVRKNVSLGANVFVINTVSDFSSVTSEHKGGINFQGSKFVEGILKWKAIVLEGDWTNKELPPYFKGIQSVKMPVLTTTGKNLFNINGNINEKYDQMSASDNPNLVDGNTIIPSSMSDWHHGKGQKIKIKKGGTYTCSFTTSGGGIVDIYGSNLRCYAANKTSTFTFTVLADCDEVVVAFATRGNARGGKIYNFQIEEGSVATSYEPYKTNILNTSEDVVLRGIGEVRDTLDCLTGEVVERIGEVILDGSEDENWTYNGKYNVFVCEDLIYNKNYLSTHLLEKTTWNGVERFDLTPSHYGITSASSGREYLSQNPLTIQYELKTPVIKTIDVQGFPYAYTNGHVQLSFGSIEQSLTPKVEYSVATNRNGQIRSNQKMVERQQKQLDRLQAMILTNLVNTQYEQTLTNLKYDLKNVREEVK